MQNKHELKEQADSVCSAEKPPAVKELESRWLSCLGLYCHISGWGFREGFDLVSVPLESFLAYQMHFIFLAAEVS